MSQDDDGGEGSGFYHDVEAADMVGDDAGKNAAENTVESQGVLYLGKFFFSLTRKHSKGVLCIWTDWSTCRGFEP